MSDKLMACLLVLVVVIILWLLTSSLLINALPIDRMHCFELRTANVDYYIGEDPNFGQKENGNAASALPQALETGLGVHLAKSWETAIRQALLPLTNNSQGAAASPSPPSKGEKKMRHFH